MSCSSRTPRCSSQSSLGASNNSSQNSASYQRENNRRLVNAESVAGICEIVEHSASEFNAVNIATAFHRMAKLWNSPVDDPCGGQLTHRAENCVRQLGDLALGHLRSIQGQGLGIVVWSLAKMGFDDSHVRHILQAFAQEAAGRLGSPECCGDESLKLGPQSLSNMLYAYALLNHHPGIELLSAIAKGIKLQLRDFSPQGLANAVWSVAKLGAEINTEVAELLRALAEESVSQLSDERTRVKFIPQNLSNMLYGFAQLGMVPGSGLMEAIGNEALRQLSSFGPQELTNMTWALAKLLGSQPRGAEIQAVLDAIPAAALVHLNSGASSRKVKPQTLSNLIFAFAVMEMQPGSEFLAAISQAIQQQVPTFKAQELASSLWGLAKLRYHPGQHLMSTALSETCRQLDKFKVQDLVAALHALAFLGSTFNANVAMLAIRIVSGRAGALHANELVSLLWALAISDQLGVEGAPALLEAAANQQPAALFSDDTIFTLLQIRAAFPGAGVFASKVPADLLCRIEEAAHTLLATDTYKDVVGNEVSSMLSSLGIPHTRSVPAASMAVIIDIALPQQQVALQLDGPSQFFGAQPFPPLGGALLQWHLLLKDKWKVVSVPFYAWQQAATQGTQRQYLLQLLSSGYSSLPFNQAAGLALLQVATQMQDLSAAVVANSLGRQLQHLCIQEEGQQQHQQQPAFSTANMHNGQFPRRCQSARQVGPTVPHRGPSCRSEARPDGHPLQQLGVQGVYTQGHSHHLLSGAANSAVMSAARGSLRDAAAPAAVHPSSFPLEAAQYSRNLSGGRLMASALQSPRVTALDRSHAHPQHAREGNRLDGYASSPAVLETYGPQAANCTSLMQQQHLYHQLHHQLSTSLQGGSSGSLAASNMMCSREASVASIWTEGSPFMATPRLDTMGSQLSSSIVDDAVRLQSNNSEDIVRSQLLNQQASNTPGWAAQHVGQLYASSDSGRPPSGALPSRRFHSHSLGNNGGGEPSLPTSMGFGDLGRQRGAPVFLSRSSGASPARVHITASNTAGGPPLAMAPTPFLAARSLCLNGGQRDYRPRGGTGAGVHANSGAPTWLGGSSAVPLHSASAGSTCMSQSSAGSTNLGVYPTKRHLSRVRDGGGSGSGSGNTLTISINELCHFWNGVPKLEVAGVTTVTAEGVAQKHGGHTQELAHMAHLKHAIEQLPAEESVVACVARLAPLNAVLFAQLLKELASDNFAHRAWQLFDWVRFLPVEHGLARLCGSDAYSVMIVLCGVCQQLYRALQLIGDMKASGMECIIQAQTALLGSAVKCGENELAADVYRQMSSGSAPISRQALQVALDVFLKLGSWKEAIGVLDHMAAQGMRVEAQTYNLAISSCMKLGETDGALDVYKRMWKEGVTPTTKTFVLLISALAKDDGALEVVIQAVVAESESGHHNTTYGAVMAACEKAGQWELAVKLFTQISELGISAGVGILNSIVAACAHSGEYSQARAIFDAMPRHNCLPDAVTFANLIRAYKKGGQWCQTVATLEAMQMSGAVPHAAVISSVIDALWHTGIPWAQARAAALFRDAVSAGKLAGAADQSKKGTLRVDLQALTVGVALLSMHQWLAAVRATPVKGFVLEVNRKLAIINGMGEHSRAQGNSSAVKEAIGATLIGAGAPFRVVVDHQRSGRLEASTQPLAEWLLSDGWLSYSAAFDVNLERLGEATMSTAEYLAVEAVQSARSALVYDSVLQYEAARCSSLQALVANRVPYLLQRERLVVGVLHAAASLSLTDQVAHAASALMDNTAAAGGEPSIALEAAFAAACLCVAYPTLDGVNTAAASPVEVFAAVFGLTTEVVDAMEGRVRAALLNSTAAVSSLHVLTLFVQRLGCTASSAPVVKQIAGSSFLLVTTVLLDPNSLRWPPSVMAAAVLISCRRRQGCVPAWPSVLSALTGYNEATTSGLSTAIAFCERLMAPSPDAVSAIIL